ncbi:MULTISPECIES: aminotransferase class I/II-fold pyridoxal phosphate-dependent enzyme [unclassified Ruminococcus]|uniref:aminotransferase class I/II-fold pyridoxal phosphate-dependent enzyme n=1 Tax=unclassified Ruminococcus TaxID=2608920 RepID=UPI002108EC57|nr:MULTISPECIES: aminotransferase class I/II-fold pyridoxal phosphate-dependent enzyme [unclassified Ruminococcus]MCQ4022155.1 aminotransferase class I/II-fold pyridoxal phosphate-dependent enzyme [Ruminococcus sp. zg-924]MCQ4115553.1 aminotransferase class I/II-fold pyridoxal phosphate-dependent enzyme [Ruminococcus sp. zg-921]
MLYNTLKLYSESGIYPFHMPGHKRNAEMAMPLSITHDMTEVDGLDDLHCADGILKDAMDNAACFFGADKTFFLVNGSTCGILASLAACTKRGDTIICARNCHKSVYNGISLLGLKPQYITPNTIPLPFGCYGSINPTDVERLLKQNIYTAAVIITSPTYEGIISDIKTISDLCHHYGVPLIVDEAHGAHLGLFGGFPNGAVKSGADIVIQSTHKTLGAVTQSALVHVCGKLADSKKIAQKLAVFETSSPSYLITESIDSTINILQKSGKNLFSAYLKRLDDFSEKVKQLKHTDILFYGNSQYEKNGEIFAFDRSKLIISAVKNGYSGAQLSKILLDKYRIQVEMSSLNYVVAMTSYCDTDEGFDRLISALREIDCGTVGSYSPKSAAMPTGYIRAMEIFEADELDKTEIPLVQAGGKICGEFLFAYPPGIPLVVPGEIITKELLIVISELKSAGVLLKSSASGCAEYITIIDNQLICEKNAAKT